MVISVVSPLCPNNTAAQVGPVTAPGRSTGRETRNVRCTATSTLDTGEGYGLVRLGCGLPTLGQDATVLGPVKHKPLSRGPSALLDRACARRPAGGQVGTAGWSAFGRTSGWIMRRGLPAGGDGPGR